MPLGRSRKTTYQLFCYTDDVNLLGDIIDTVKENTKSLIEVSTEVRLEVHAEKTKYTSILLSHHQEAWQNHDIKIANRSLESMTQLKYFGTTVTNKKLIKRDIKRRQFG
jgi:hypothetical protein